MCIAIHLFPLWRTNCLLPFINQFIIWAVFTLQRTQGERATQISIPHGLKMTKTQACPRWCIFVESNTRLWIDKICCSLKISQYFYMICQKPLDLLLNWMIKQSLAFTQKNFWILDFWWGRSYGRFFTIADRDLVQL